ncbi:hypothetical protein G9A89_011426 [Geosiphon pyriformis]|nr:hypothetical protein G9A89_011426 [Geosiphon pyriformis]
MSSWEWEEDKKNKKKGKEKETTQTTTLICVNCGKKLSLMCTCCGNDEKYSMATRFYCCPCILEHFERPKRPCLACGKTLLDEGIWNDIPGRGGTCDISCQYTILISDWIRKRTPIEAVWRRAVQQLDSCPYDDDKIWQMALVKIKETMPKEIKMIKNNPPEPLELDWDTEPIINLLDLEQFHKHYQELAPTREEQEQRCASESESPINCNLNSNDDNDNNGSSSIQIGNDDKNDSDSDSKPNLNYEQYIALPDLSKEQELK